MRTIRNANSGDLAEFRNLWDLSFSDSLNFRDWFFANRFVPEYSICMEEEGKIVSAVQSIPYILKIRDTLVPATMMVGACTHPDYKKRGYMKELYTWYMNYMNTIGISLCAHTPAVLRTYFYVGHFPVSDTAFLSIKKAQDTKDESAKPLDMTKESAAILKCYLKKASNYSGMVYRSLSDMRLKLADYMADGGEAIGLWENNGLIGYGIYYNSENLLHGEEIIALNPEAEQKIVDCLIHLGCNKEVRLKLPPDTKASSSQGTLEINPRNVLGLADLPKLLNSLGQNLEYTIKINDSVVPKNNGTFNLRGEPSNDKAVFETDAGNVLQWLVGYKSLLELSQEGVLTIYDADCVKQLDKMLPKQICHIIDEY